MLHWTFKSGIETGLDTAVHSFYEWMKSHHITGMEFTMYGFNAVTVEIFKVGDEYRVRLADEDAYGVHFLEEEEYDEWKKERLLKQENGFISNEHVKWATEPPMTENAKMFLPSLLSIWKEKRENEINDIIYRLPGSYVSIAHHYTDEDGFYIYDISNLF